MQKQIQQEPQYKMIIIGDSGVGKTTLTRFLLDQKMIYTEENYQTTNVQDRDWNLNPNDTIKIYDLPGLMLYRRFTRNCHHNAKIVIYMFSFADYDSFKNLESWSKQCPQIAKDAKIYLVGNKNDIKVENQQTQLSQFSYKQSFLGNNLYTKFQPKKQQLNQLKIKIKYKQYFAISLKQPEYNLTKLKDTLKKKIQQNEESIKTKTNFEKSQIPEKNKTYCCCLII